MAADATSELLAALETVCEALHALPGVTGTGIGLSEQEQDGEHGPERPERAMIQVFVAAPRHLTSVRLAASRLLRGLPWETVVQPPPRADLDHSPTSTQEE